MTKPPKPPPASPPVAKPSPYEQTELTNTGLKRNLQPAPKIPAPVRAPGPIQLGDSVRVDVDRVDFMNRKPIHNAIIAASINGQLGHVTAMEIIGGEMMLRVDTGHASMMVPAECCTVETMPVADTSVPRSAPERMRKPPGAGGYKLT